ncbi:ferredoxin-type protein NapG [Magnetospirillum moscoviense]|uniref:Ferredoxin-type protein NapG n=1 Tax=Magnetospirillum moscoviense TaxID=1437059 RepID=A0A178MYI7_9PROT|nr:ferredoxin-type protein NapG [Magnetospirillum moscoviense]MBF0324840.1 ferredoxin-type protein NapG [Alphaproteobacteria bacterium]OAN63223.1 ferredoxin-type protein NapG [Magnetospirillum moscoviense]
MTDKGKHTGAVSRRGLLAQTVRAACGAGVLALLLAVPARKRAEAVALRPPGAIAADDFLSACVRCGLCVRDCPYDTLKLSDIGDGQPLGTPFYNARSVPCEMCEHIPCVTACPTGALDKSLTDIRDARMGTAVLVGQETCLNFLGLRCDVCYRVCPLIDQAITLERHHNERTGKHAMFIPTVHTDKCTGCGKCEKGCVLDEAAIRVLPHNLAVGVLGAHYRLGWKEKEKAGKSLIDGIIDLPDRMPEPPAAMPSPERLPGGGFKEFKP